MVTMDRAWRELPQLDVAKRMPVKYENDEIAVKEQQW
jgi:hypothetical protein